MNKSESGKLINTGVKLEEALHSRLKALGALKDRSPHWLMKAAIEEYVRREEDRERQKAEDMDRWRAYRQSGHAIAQDKVEQWLASWDNGDELPCPK